MNKYEEALLKKVCNKCVVSIQNLDDKAHNNYTMSINFDEGNFVLNQNENVTLTKYQLLFGFPNENPIEELSYSIKGKKYNAILVDQKNSNTLYFPEIYEKCKGQGKLYIVDVDFENKTDYIEFKFINNLVDPIKVDIKYIDANKEKYFQKVEKERVQGLLNKLSLNCKVGDSLVNFFWQNVSDEVAKTRIELFLDNKQLIMREDLAPGMMFKSIQGLAYGTYYYKVTQLNSKDEIIVSTEMLVFRISNPNFHEVII